MTTKRKSLKELNRFIQNDIEHQKQAMKNFEGQENPQVKELFNNAKIRLEVMEDIKRYIEDGSTYQFCKIEQIN